MLLLLLGGQIAKNPVNGGDLEGEKRIYYQLRNTNPVAN